MESTNPGVDAPDRLYSWDELRPFIGNVSRTTWWRAIKRGDAPAGIVTTMGRIAWSGADIVEWQRSRSRSRSGSVA